ncbi:transcription factor TGA7-like [Gastrolobium bilobum]|uniref:transcription factor TGA7-like n=1 Tax=Gastrolobium bilobum TaxID=150636 RepID=UPI002AB1BC25|nr:transcription factor TGA7-like [Gastrolobium bilobum]
MRDLTKRKIGGHLAEEQSCPKKPTLVKPLPLRAPAKVLLGTGSSFQPWNKPSGNIIGLGIAEASSSGMENNKQNIENSNSDHPAKENPTNGGGATTDDNTTKTDCNTKPEIMDRKLKRIISNRHSAQRSRMKKKAYVEDLESKAKSYKEKIAQLHPQIEAEQSQLHLLQINQHKLKLHMAAREKQRILQEVAIEKNRAEVDRLRELQRKLIAEAQARMMNSGASLQLISNSNLNPSGLGGLAHKNFDQALNGVETSKRQVDNAQPPQSQSQMGIAKWDNRRSILNFNLVKSEPES